jgi:hypothetical protein
MYGERFAQQDRLTLENFESASIVLHGTVVETGEKRVVFERNDVRFPIFVVAGTLILVPDKEREQALNEEERARFVAAGRPIVHEGSIQDIAVGQTTEVAAQYINDGTFQASRIIVLPSF